MRHIQTTYPESMRKLKKRMEDMNRVIEQLTAAVTQPTDICTLSQAKCAVYVSTGNSLVSKLRRQTTWKKTGDTASSHREMSTLENFYIPLDKKQSSNKPPNPSHPFLDTASPGPWYLARREEKQISFRDYRHRQYGDFMSRGKRSIM